MNLFVPLCVTVLLSIGTLCAEGTPVENQWAVLVAGSNEYSNYRHQADVAHVYRLLIERGFKKEHIITFAFNDIAYNTRNPYKGEIFNNPEYVDYYQGLEIDYKGKEVTVENFAHVMLGSKALKAKGKKVLESTSSDNVLLYYSDHGGYNVLSMIDEVLYSSTLSHLITRMHGSKKYNKMLLLIEACHSGSMFSGVLPNNLNAIALTAANPYESSYAEYLDYFIHAYLSDEWTVSWLEHIEKTDLSQYSILSMHKRAVQYTHESNPKIYGDMSLRHLTLDNFFGPQTSRVNKNNNITKKSVQKQRGVPSHEVDAITFAQEYIDKVNDVSKRTEALENLFQVLQKRKLAQRSFEMIMTETKRQSGMNGLILSGSANMLQSECSEAAISAYVKQCFSMNQVANLGKKFALIHDICNKKAVPTDALLSIIKDVCLKTRSMILQ